MKKPSPPALVLAAGCLSAALFSAACAPQQVVSPRVQGLRVAAGAPRPASAPGDERWWQVILHVHSALNFVWLYDDVSEPIADEKRDAVARAHDLFSRMQHYRPDVIESLLKR